MATMQRWLALATTLAACYGPTATPGAPCGAGDVCPSGQECRAQVCVLAGTPYDSALAVDTITIDAPPDAPGYIPWTGVTELTSLNSVGAKSDPSITTDKLTLAMSGQPPAGTDDIYLATRSALTDTFTPAALTALNSAMASEKSPEIDPAGTTLWFVSDRVTAGNYDVYVSTFSGGTWSAPTLRTDLSSTSSDGDVAVSPDQLTAVVSRNTSQLFVYSRATTADPFSGGTRHSELEITADIAAPTITNGGQVICFHAGNPRDLYVSHRKPNGTYAMPQPVTELNTVAVRDAAPFVLQTDDFMVFERAGKIVQASR